MKYNPRKRKATKKIEKQSNAKSKNKNTLVSRNAGYEKNLHPGGRKFIFLNQFN